MCPVKSLTAYSCFLNSQSQSLVRGGALHRHAVLLRTNIHTRHQKRRRKSKQRSRRLYVLYISSPDTFGSTEVHSPVASCPVCTCSQVCTYSGSSSNSDTETETPPTVSHPPLPHRKPRIISRSFRSRSGQLKNFYFPKIKNNSAQLMSPLLLPA